MKHNYLFIILIIITSSTFPIEVIAQSNNLNISFLLDLSDRISPIKNPNRAMPYYQRDLEYIKTIERAFVTHVKTKRIIQLNDQMQVFFEPAPNDSQINAMSQSLRINIDKRSSKEMINNIDKTFTAIPSKIYQTAIAEKKYMGSDIWKFFQNKAKKYCVTANHRNILVVLTDGYMYHQNTKFTSGNKSSYLTPAYLKSKQLNTIKFEAIMTKNQIGFLPATSGLENLEVIVLGINPAKGNPFEEQVINKYWADWLKSMGVKKYYLNSAELPSDVEPILQKIISGIM